MEKSTSRMQRDPLIDLTNATGGDNFLPPPVDLFAVAGKKVDNLFDEQHRKAWHEDSADVARCDFTPNRVSARLCYSSFRCLCLWKRSLYGRTLTDIKSDQDMVPFITNQMAPFIAQCLGPNLSPRDFVMVTPPKRRHKVNNFASMCAGAIAIRLGIAFVDDCASCKSRERINPVFTLERVPEQRNVIIFDDFVTTTSTMNAMWNLLKNAGKNPVCFAAVNNAK